MKPKFKKIFSLILKLPLILIVLASFFAGIYAAYFNVSDIGWESPIIMGVCIIMYILSVYITKGGNDATKNK